MKIVTTLALVAALAGLSSCGSAPAPAPSPAPTYDIPSGK